MSDWVYYALYDPSDSSLESPEGLLRRRTNALRHDAYALGTDGRWWLSDIPALIVLGHDYGHLAEITEQHADAIMKEWIRIGRIPSWPREAEIPKK